MKISQAFIPVLHNLSTNSERITSHKLMLKSGMIQQIAKGIYCWLPLGLRVLNKVIQILREEQNSIGGIELQLPVLQPAKLWQESNRYKVYGKELLHIYDREQNELVYAPTNEELLCEIAKYGLKSYQDLPKLIYCIGSKFRDEIRPRFGVMRSREFLMKDTYSFDLTEAQAIQTYYKVFVSYLRIFKRLGLTIIPAQANSGPIGGNLNHEFVLLADKGESKVKYNPQVLEFIANLDLQQNDFAAIFHQFDLFKSQISEHREEHQSIDHSDYSANAIELGHIFYFGTKYSKTMNISVMNKDNIKIHPFMGSYGIGISRLIAAIVETSNDIQGIIWPVIIAPYQVALINLSPLSPTAIQTCEALYQELCTAKIEVIYHDTHASVGSKFALMDLIGIPYHLIIGEQELQKHTVTLKKRSTGEKTSYSLSTITNYLLTTLAIA